MVPRVMLKVGNVSVPLGWTGSNCELPCPSGLHGLDCIQDCLCQNGAMCDPQTGSCTCSVGWRGLVCDQPCTEDTYGLKL